MGAAFSIFTFQSISVRVSLFTATVDVRIDTLDCTGILIVVLSTLLDY
jgi:hypothetical protein